MSDTDLLADVLKERFGHVEIRHDYGWSGNTALSVLDCVLSLNRRYDSVVFPRIQAFANRYPKVTELSHLKSMFDAYEEVGAFSREKLNYNDVRREHTIRGVVAYLTAIQANHSGETEWERLQAWAHSVQPSDYTQVGVKGFGLAGFQYLRMLFGVQTTKPDVHIIRFVSTITGKSVNDMTALCLLEQAAKQANLPLREVDGAIWEAGTRGETTPVPPKIKEPAAPEETVRHKFKEPAKPFIVPAPKPPRPWWQFWRRNY